MSGYEVIDYFNAEGENVIALEIQSGQYSGTIFSFGEVSFPDPNKPLLKFNRTIHVAKGNTDTDEFNTFIGDILVEIIEHSLETRDIVFKGGTNV